MINSGYKSALIIKREQEEEIVMSVGYSRFK